MDFTTPKAVGQDIDKFDFIQLKNGNGYDHNWVLNTQGDINQLAAKLTSLQVESHWKFIRMNPVFKSTAETSWMVH